jgi:sucrose-6-phosphate hydrolase SacC (GH32 family)
MPFNQQMAFPTDLSLRTTTEGIRLFRWPVPEIQRLYVKSHVFKNLSAEAATRALSRITPELVDLSIEFEPGPDGRLDLTVRGIRISFGETLSYRNAARVPYAVKSVTFNGVSCPARVIDGKVKLRVLGDRTSMELYVNDGETVASTYAFDAPGSLDLKVEAGEGVKIRHLLVNELKSAWGRGPGVP